MKGSELEWAIEKHITSQVMSGIIPITIEHILQQVYLEMLCGDLPEYTSCKGYIPTNVGHILWQVYPEMLVIYSVRGTISHSVKAMCL